MDAVPQGVVSREQGKEGAVYCGGGY